MRPGLFGNVIETLQDRLTAAIRRQLAPEAMEFRHKWKEVKTPGGMIIPKLSACSRRTSDSDCSGSATGWPTPNVPNGGRMGSPTQTRADGSKKQLSPEEAATLAGWPTPNTDDRKSKNHGRNLGAAVEEGLLAGWPTPMAGSPATDGWATPSATTWGGTPEAHLARKQAAIDAGSSMGLVVSNLDSQVQLLASPWATPAARDHKSESATAEFNAERDSHPRGKPLSYQATGATADSSSAGTEKPVAYRLNARFSLWLQGYPEEWASCGERGIASCRKLRRRSSRRT